MDRSSESHDEIGASGFDTGKHLAHVYLVDHYVESDVVAGIGVDLVDCHAFGRNDLARMTRYTDFNVPPDAPVECERVVTCVAGFYRHYVPHGSDSAAVGNEVERRVRDPCLAADLSFLRIARPYASGFCYNRRAA